MLTTCPITGVCIKRFALSVLASFVFLYAYDYVVNVFLLMDLYDQTPQLWRSAADMETKLPFIWVTQLLKALVISLIFTRHYEAKGVGEGMRFGILIGLVLGIEMAMSYAWMPISGALAIAWFFAGLFQGVGLGVVNSLTYRK